ncbi:small integral membrane protein 12 isoform X1 [Corapipo altera]|uniref:small integral membrane protein 12 isoform X1 n=1 Tax=Corapipo altera TaxID=415028 RepID=UPI000FD641F9|nr:small integral membrane protein 12 isoform X1 [Corapipo altera]
MWSVLWAAVRSKAPYVTFPVAFVVGLVGSQLEWFLRGDPPATAQDEKSISELREDRKLQEIAGEDLTKVWLLPWRDRRRRLDLSAVRWGQAEHRQQEELLPCFQMPCGSW